MTTSAPKVRTVCQLTGEKAGKPSVFFQALNEANRRVLDAAIIADTFARAVGNYQCSCGESFEFVDGMGIDDYAALNRWLGHHGRCAS